MRRIHGPVFSRITHRALPAIVLLLEMVFPLQLIAEQTGRIDVGVSMMLGGRYDDMRLCVATGNGMKGGPVADIMFTFRYGLSERLSAGFDLPVMRPVLFGLAFKLLQFEPMLVLDWKAPGDRTDFLLSPCIGASFHYGPDYRSDKRNRSPSFFAAGPLLSVRCGLGFRNERGETPNVIALRPFYTALFSDNHGTGTVIGGALEYLRSF